MNTANRVYYAARETDEQHSAKMQELLDAQTQYDVELVENDTFWTWTFADWKDSPWYGDEDEQPEYSWDMYRVFKPSEKN